MKNMGNEMNRILKVCTLIALTVQTSYIEGFGKDINPLLQYSISMPEPLQIIYSMLRFFVRD
jgi:hypothetical protein